MMAPKSLRESLGPGLSYSGTTESTRLVGGAEQDRDNLRAFGYFDAQPVISQRVANETIKVLTAMR